jgi:2-polyprenyl-3-methyl-5-hydroxy-6-metoxy-1,4-benzoquinol methylase
MTVEVAIDYPHPTSDGDHTSGYLWPPIIKILQSQSARRIFEVGCGNGAFARRLKSKGFEVCGIDASGEGVQKANKSDPTMRLELGSAYQPLVGRFGQFPIVISLEVVGHLYDPRLFAQRIYELLEPGGIAIVSTPFHGYVKNVLTAVLGKWEQHHNPLWDHGMIKFWSIATLTQLFAEKGLICEEVVRVGRVSAIAKSMILLFRKKNS